ncbi:hypothetical protein [Haloferula rosea]|uniref:Uncharacterized protein n=1 Tax=Haloferula rosea TaxID=490093 RepID=A0A934RGC8_9BACT|nr:hypothetical protein [Haloferula rosea]MBK1828669.1 hypothetical protein [Haloferula rosea]
MMNEPSPVLASSRQRIGLAFLIGGAVSFLCIFLSEDGRNVFHFIRSAIRDPIGYLDAESSIVLSTFLTLSAVALASPCLIKWLPSSLLMRVILRVFSGLTASVFLYFCAEYGMEGEPVLIFLVLSPLLTFSGLLIVKPDPRPSILEH